MANFTYRSVSRNRIRVYQGAKQMGHIKRSMFGWRVIGNPSGVKGDHYATLAECKAALEASHELAKALASA